MTLAHPNYLEEKAVEIIDKAEDLGLV